VIDDPDTSGAFDDEEPRIPGWRGDVDGLIEVPDLDELHPGGRLLALGGLASGREADHGEEADQTQRKKDEPQIVAD
jgi:hypothetical protein